jgi:hypothetical protein
MARLTGRLRLLGEAPHGGELTATITSVLCAAELFIHSLSSGVFKAHRSEPSSVDSIASE